MLVPAGKQIKNFQGMIVMNELSAFVWEKLQAPTTRDALLAEILAEYEIDEQTAAADLDPLLDELNRYGVIEA